MIPQTTPYLEALPILTLIIILTSEHSTHRLFGSWVLGIKGTLQLVRDCKQRTWTILVFLLQDLTLLSGIAIYFLFAICSVLQVYCHLSTQENNSKALKAPSKVEVPFLGTMLPRNSECS